MKKLAKHLNYANVVATLALFLVLGGGAAFAATHKIGTRELRAGAVTAAKIKKGAVVEGKLADGAVSAAKLVPSVVGAGQLADGAVTGPKLAPSSVGSASVVDGSLTAADLAAGTIPTTVRNSEAVGGEQIKSFSKEVGEGQGTLLEFAGVKLTYSVVSTNPSLSVASLRGNDAHLLADGAEDPDVAFSVSNGNLGSVASRISEGHRGAGTAILRFADGSVTTIEYAWNLQAAGLAQFYGKVIGAP